MTDSVFNLAEKAAELLKARNLRVSFAESCTGGMLAAALVSVPGSSAVFDESIVTYSNEAKIKYTDVTREVLDKHGAVSAETALLMAAGIRRQSGADIGISVTGIASECLSSKPVGTVYIAVSTEIKTAARHFLFSGGRNEVREQSTAQALTMLQEVLYNDELGLQ
jgi:nicotinamide-nucleotide amidase